MFTLLFRGARTPAHTPHRAPARRRSFVPRLDVLEDRTALSTLTVTSLADTGVPGDGSLRGEIAAAAPGDTIDFAPSLSGTINLGSDLTIDRDLTVQGRLDPAGNPLVALASYWREDGIDLAVNAGVTAEVSGLTFTGATGAAVLNRGTLTLSRVAVTGNSVGSLAPGWGLPYNGTVSNEGTLVVRDSRIDRNLLRTGGNMTAGGGGIYSAGGALTVSDTTVTGNEVSDLYAAGGGIYVAGGTAVITNSTISGNRAAAYGGGIFAAAATLTMTGCTISDNSAWYYGGGIYASGTARISDCVVTGNTTTDCGGGIYFDHGTSGSLTLTGSTVANNRADGDGGGIYIRRHGTAVTVTSST